MFSTFQLLGLFLPSSSTSKRHKEARSKTLAVTYLMLCAMACAARTPPLTPWALWVWPPRSRCGVHPICSLLVHWQMDPGTSALMTEPRMVRMACSSSVYKNSFTSLDFPKVKPVPLSDLSWFISPLGRAALSVRDSLWLVQLEIGGRHVQWARAFQNFIWAKTGRKLRWALVILSL